jgi:hypothetical protein
VVAADGAAVVDPVARGPGGDASEFLDEEFWLGAWLVEGRSWQRLVFALGSGLDETSGKSTSLLSGAFVG